MIKLFFMFLKMYWILWEYMLQFFYQVSQIGKKCELLIIYILRGGGYMSESDISDIIPIINLKIIRRCFYELQPRNPQKQI